MSIISEALKKARESRDEGRDAVRRRESVEAAPARRRPEGVPVPAERSDGRSRFIVILAVILIVTPIALQLFSHAPKSGPEGRSARNAGPGRAQFAVEERPVFFGSQRPSFSLSGIAQFQDSYMAVINGHILKTGDEVQGAKVVVISADAVELDLNGERILLEKTF